MIFQKLCHSLPFSNIIIYFTLFCSDSFKFQILFKPSQKISTVYSYWHLNHIWKSYQNTRSRLLQRVFFPTFASGSFSLSSHLNKGEHFISSSHAPSQPAFPYSQISHVYVKMCLPCVNKQRSLHICLLLRKTNIKKIANRAVFWSPSVSLLPVSSVTPLSPKPGKNY